MSALGYVIWVLHFPISQSVIRKFLCDGVLGFVSICKHIYKVFCVSFVTNASWRKIKVLFLFSFLMGHLNVLWKGKLFQHKCCCNETHYSISIFIYFCNFYIFYKFILVIDSLEWFGRKLYNWYNKSVKIPTIRRHFFNLQLEACFFQHQRVAIWNCTLKMRFSQNGEIAFSKCNFNFFLG